MEKMFVRYPKTKAEFIANNLESKYNSSIVFIGDGECIYTHGKYFGSLEDAVAEIGDLKDQVTNLKYFSKIKAGDVTASATGKDGIITFNASDPSTVSVSADSNGVTIGLTSDFINKVNTAATQAEAAATKTELSQETQRAQNVEGNLQSTINYNTGKIVDLENKVGNDTVSNQIDAKITALDLENTYDAKGSAETAKSEAIASAQTDATNKANAALESATSYTDGEITKLGNIYTPQSAFQSHVTNLNVHVTAELLSKWNNAAENIEAFLDENAVSDSVVNTLKEIQEYIESDGTAADLMTQNIAKAQEAADKAQEEVDALEGVVASNLAEAKNYTVDIIKSLKFTDTAVTGKYVSAVSETNGKISVTRADLPTLTTGSDAGTVNFNGNNVKVNGLGSAAYTESTAYATSEQGAKADAAAPQATTYTKDEVDAMWTWEEL